MQVTCVCAGRGKIGADELFRLEGNRRLCTRSINTVSHRLSGSTRARTTPARPFQGTEIQFFARRLHRGLCRVFFPFHHGDCAFAFAVALPST